MPLRSEAVRPEGDDEVRRMVAGLLAMGLLVGVVACSDDGGKDPGGGKAGGPTTSGGDGELGVAPSAEEAAGLIPEAWWTKRQADYLDFVTEEPTEPGSPLSLLARAEADERAGKDVDLSMATPQDFQPTFEKLKTFQDTGDFDINELLALWVRHHDALTPEMQEALKTRLLAFKYWWTEPTPKGVIDSQYYWTENHQIIYLADEYIAGQTFPDETFTNSGMTGKEHVAHATERLATWFEWRSRWGFSEWLSNVYWTEDMKGLLLLAELAQDPKIAREASMMLDLLFVELAGHVQRGTFGATHGRSYQKDKLNGQDEDTFSLTKMAFDDTPAPYENRDNAILLATAHRYRPPEVARKIARSRTPATFNLRAGIPLDPLAEVDPKVKAPYGLSFTGEKGLMAWWAMGAQFPWQVAPLSAATVKKYDLFKTTNFKQAASLASVVETATDDEIRALARSLAIQVNPGLVSQVDTTTYRGRDVMLSTAQDWRPGQRGEQDHIWQATIDPDALVFTTHPRDDVPSADDPNAREGYWTGDGAMPRSAQDRNVNISIYAPQYDGGGGVGTGAYSFTYLDETHAFFPTEHFDQVVRKDGWTIGKKGDGYIALWSYRPTEWRTYDPKTEFTRGLTKPFDLVAKGGPDNVWITEVADAKDWERVGDAGPWNAFVQAVTESKPQVTPATACADGETCEHQPADGYGVRYDSPSRGEITFGWTPNEPTPIPLTVDGKDIDLHPKDAARWDAPYATSAWDSRTYEAKLDGATLDLDFAKGTRRTTR